jgi:hypothetical protein
LAEKLDFLYLCAQNAYPSYEANHGAVPEFPDDMTDSWHFFVLKKRKRVFKKKNLKRSHGAPRLPHPRGTVRTPPPPRTPAGATGGWCEKLKERELPPFIRARVRAAKT